MLDFRVDTFIELCRTRNYTKTAENLHMTQPAVSQHIKYLEEFYGCKLFNYNKKVLTITEQGEALYKYLLTMSSDANKIREEIKNIDISKKNLHFGATFTIGEFIIPKIISEISSKYPEINISFIIRDTSELLEELKKGNIDFAFIEGFFEKTEYENYLFSKERFVGICAANNPIATEITKFDDIVKERIILRENGSGTRDIFEKILYDNNLSLNDFNKKYEIENINIIKELVKENKGISFIYERAVEKEILMRKLAVINLENFYEEREFNFVFLKNSIHEEEYKKWYEFMKKRYSI
ncbi:LysR family transcriptional regulator [Fusobacterium mortiferum]|jgi:DNA-binding transcriptional LysR family regulator|uniref:LysR family transcriptional regulator n=1 Tax=Fusobacterium mortiferum TaxID=850 RepID=A0A414PZ37_FUSMR|nr:LysR family transcriptional regulator [Fusobacterium mortiferum]MCI6383253.1 LysR family transcriptional regulator [Fusobacterium mortiferum]RGN01263.1 LysR family transcriptional regulator [Fusobacterium mortiferum]RHF73828.1 LysR family transcriptional regulator [Fusobacterium mortiferum]